MDRSLVGFYRRFKQQIDPPGIPTGAILKHPDVQLALEQRFFNIPAQELSAYQAKILRTVIERIQNAITDNEDEEVSDHLMTLFATVPQSRPQIDLSKTLVEYFPPVSLDEDVTPIRILEAKKIIGSGPNTGLRTWEASLRLAHYLHANPELVQQRAILELGAGTGFLSMFCAAYLSPAQVRVTDGHEDVLASLQHNIELNTSLFDAARVAKPATKKLFWGDEDDMNAVLSPSVKIGNGTSQATDSGNQLDLIIGADITYDPDACIALASTLSILSRHNPKATILISATQRNLETMEVFLRACRDAGQEDVSHGGRLSVEEITEEEFSVPSFATQTGCFHNVVSPIRLWRIRAAQQQIQT